jgi:hypothetical protein
MFGVLLSTAWGDQIVLKDGDRISGKVVKKDGKTLTVDSKNFGTVTLKWADVETINIQDPVNVVLSGDRAIKGAITTEDGRLVVDSPGTPQTVLPADVVALRNDAEQRAYERLLRPGLLDLWAITGSLNIAGANGNAEASTLTTPINFVRASNTTRTTAYFNSIRSTATVNGLSAQTANAIRGGWAYNRNVTKRLFFNGFNDYEYDKFQSLDLRVVLGSGLGFEVLRSDNARLSVLAGAAWNREAFGPAAPAVSFTRNSAEAYWGDDFAHKLNTRTALTQSFRMFNNLINSGEYRVNFDVGATTSLMKWLTWNIALSDRYLSNPVPGRKKNDFLYSTGFGFKFAR